MTAANSVNPDPFVLQTYKSTMCFLTSFAVLVPPISEQYHFSPWGLLSGLLWVIGGICGIFGIRNSGLAISVGTWSAITVLISFTWGIFIFGERVVSVLGTLVGIWLMIVGFSGMAYFSSPGVMRDFEDDARWREGREERLRLEREEIERGREERRRLRERERERRERERRERQNRNQSLDSNNENENENEIEIGAKNDFKQPLLEDYSKNDDEEKLISGSDRSNNTNQQQMEENSSGNTSPVTVGGSESPDSDVDINGNGNGNDNDNDNHNGNNERERGHDTFTDHDHNNNNNNNTDETKIMFLGMKCDRWRLGIIGAAMDGLFGGGNLIPMHYSPYTGSEYLISFATGAMVVTIVFWIIRLIYNISIHETKSIRGGWEALPSMHIRKLFLPGVFAGTLWSMGNIGQIMTVTYLGESIGMSIVQSSMIVSGLLGILWFREIKGVQTIALWSLSAVATFVGIIFLSHQHKA